MKHVHENCFDFVSEECSELAHKAIGYDFSETVKCVEKSFDGGYVNWNSDNRILKAN